MQATGLEKLLTTDDLRRLLKRSRALNFSHVPDSRFDRDLDPDGFHISVTSWYHSPDLQFWNRAGIKHDWNFAHNGGVNVRAVVLCKMRGRTEPAELMFDFDQHDFEALPDVPPIPVQVDGASRLRKGGAA
jgi:hypothetical protein